jgi:hypothetical protein
MFLRLSLVSGAYVVVFINLLSEDLSRRSIVRDFLILIHVQYLELTPWTRILIVKLSFAQLIRNFPTFYAK